MASRRNNRHHTPRVFRSENLEDRRLLAADLDVVQPVSDTILSHDVVVAAPDESTPFGPTIFSVQRTADFNSDGVIDDLDIDVLFAEIRQGTHQPLFDLTQDGVVDHADVEMLVHDILDINFGDLNLDGEVNDQDFEVVYQNRFQELSGWRFGDFNGDTVVDGSDFNIWNANRLKSRPSAERSPQSNGTDSANFATTEASTNDRIDELSVSTVAERPDPVTVTDGNPTFAGGVAKGDFNQDGQIDDSDIDLLCTDMHSIDYNPNFDLNEDGVVDMLDMDELISNVLNTRYGDANLDRVVDELDWEALRQQLFTVGGGWANGDFNCDNVRDGSDFGLWNANRHETTSERNGGVPVVEKVATVDRQPVVALPVVAPVIQMPTMNHLAPNADVAKRDRVATGRRLLSSSLR